MNSPLIRTYRLVPRGGGGLSCDEAGVALGPAELVRVGADAAGRRRCEASPLQALARIVSAAYGPQPKNVVLRLHRGLRRAAQAIERGELCLAGIESVLLGLPDLTRPGLEKLAEIAKLEKWGTAWQDQPRVPAGESDGGQWTTEGGPGGAPAVDVKPAAHVSPHAPTSRQKPSLPLEDGAYRPGVDDPQVVLTAGGAEEESRGSNGPPEEFPRLVDMFPGFGNLPALAIPYAPINAFLGNSAAVDEADQEAVMGFYWALVKDIKRVDPSFVDRELLPLDGIAGLSRQGRTNLLNHLQMVRAAAYYRILGDVEPLQVETVLFLRSAVDAAYDEAVSEADAGRLQPRLSREEAIGNWVDFEVRKDLKNMFASYDIPYGPRGEITINNRDYETSENDSTYRIPDARLGNVAFDWTLSEKTISTPQIQGFFRADSQPRAVIIVRPSQLGPNNTYLILKPDNAWLYPRL